MRIYVPLNSQDLALAQLSERKCYSVDTALIELYEQTEWAGDEEMAELALTLASLDSYVLGEEADPRIVASADVPECDLKATGQPGEYYLQKPVNWEDVQCLHLDEGDALALGEQLRRLDAKQVLPYLLGESEQAPEEIAELCDALLAEPLAWYDSSELQKVRALFGRVGE